MSVLRVGVVLPVSRMFPRLDHDLLAGLRGALDAQGANYELAIEAAGAAANPAVVVERVQRLLLQHRPHVIVAVIGSAMLRHVGAFIRDARVPLVVVNLGAEPLLHGGARSPYVFHNSFNLWQSTYALGSWAARTLGRRACLAAGFHESGYGIVSAFWHGFCDTGGGTIVSTEVTHKESSEDDASEALRRIASRDPEFVISLYAGRSAFSFVSAWGRSDAVRTLPLIATPFLAHRQWLGDMGDAALGIRTAFSWDQSHNSDARQRFVGACTAAEWPDPDAFALLGYETGLALAGAAAQLGDARLSGDALRDAIPSVTVESPRGSHRFDDDTGEMPTADYLLEIRRASGGMAHLTRIGELALPERYAADHAAFRAQELRSGWTNAYMVT